jgi:nicotinamide-nucleotide amidase
MTAPSDVDLQQLARSVGDHLLPRAGTLVTAESCTGGWIAKTCTDVAGSSRWFQGGVVAYSNFLKVALLDVPEGLLAQHGAVSGRSCGRWQPGPWLAPAAPCPSP